jgi:phosphatidylinositol dimannoside acyltransferase
MRGLLLTAGLRLADLVARALPSRVAYLVADTAGRTWHRFAPRRRALVTESLTRVCAATDRPTDPGSMRRLVRDAFVHHARYYLELLRAPHYPRDRIDEYVSAEDWDQLEPILRGGVVVASLHLGNFEPFGHLLADHGFRVVAPVEEIEPPQLFAFLLARRGAGRGAQIIPLAKSRRPMVEVLRQGGIVGVIADRDLDGDGIEVDMFGLPTTLPAGPAALALMTDRPLLVASCMRIGPDRFRGRTWLVETERTGDRRADAEAMTREMGKHFEVAIGQLPEQWWASFQPYWTDQRERGGS